MFRLPSFAVVCLVPSILSPSCLGGGFDAHGELTRLYEEARADLSALANAAREQGLTLEADRAEAWLRPRDDQKVYLPILPTRLGSLQPEEGCSPALSDWHERFAAIRRKTAEGLFLRARQAAKRNHPSLAFELVLLALEQDPDHAGARRVLGFEEYEGHWRSGFEVRKLRAGHVWDSRFGWTPRSRIERYEKGERYVKGRWISKEEDDRLHRDSPRGWTTETWHYQILTNHSREMGAKLGEKLEEFHLVWKILFIRYYAGEAYVASLFGDRAGQAPVQVPRHRIVFYRNKEDYENALSPYFPNGVEGTLGVYVDRARTAFFFLDEERADDRTLYHEATHQLFHESRRVAQGVGVRWNSWILEGAALYMESLRRENGYYILGGFEDARMAAARHRLIQDGYYVPLQALTATGMGPLQADPNLPMLYSQMAGLTHFLIHGKEGRYRDALIEYLRAVYEGRDTPLTLEGLTGTTYSTLDREYREFIQTAPARTTQAKGAGSDGD